MCIFLSDNTELDNDLKLDDPSWILSDTNPEYHPIQDNLLRQLANKRSIVCWSIYNKLIE